MLGNNDNDEQFGGASLHVVVVVVVVDSTTNLNGHVWRGRLNKLIRPQLQSRLDFIGR